MGAHIATNTVTRIMSDLSDFMLLQQWLSPAFPIGGFAYSHGLETLVAKGDIKSADDLAMWLRTLIEQGSIRSDASLLYRAFHAVDSEELLQIDAQARAFATTQERRRETVLQGTAFTDTCNSIWKLDLPPMALPVAVGRAAKLKGISIETLQPLYLQSVVSNLISVAVRLVPLGQTEGQKVLTELTPMLLDVPCEEQLLFTNTFLWDQAAMQHETLQPKLFRS